MKVVFFKTATGSEPVKKYLEKLPVPERAKILAALDALRECGVDGALVVLKHIDGKLWEIKISAQRIFYVMISGPILVLLHAYKKEGKGHQKRNYKSLKKE